MQLKTDKTIFPDFEVLLCPVCGFEYIHPISVRIATGEYDTIIDQDGQRTVWKPTPETNKAESKRGVRIFIEYVCENGGHHGYLIFQFHKGNTFVEHEKLPETNEVKTLWRT